MNHNRGSRQRLTDNDRDNFMEELRVVIDKNLDIDPDRLRYRPLEDGEEVVVMRSRIARQKSPPSSL